ncbi:MAG TPA: hypothetical protein VJL80_06415 [Aeromicrobium sp.]|nr:hypothetical protein [Aeromicrobium sp.]HKY57652.1 hypothetical protein [Aeromicrobium sp.]
MPLDRAHVTVASRIMLPTYIGFFLIIGCNYIIDPPRLAQSPMLRFADSLMSLQVWGSLFVACSLIMAAAMWSKRRTLYRFGLILAGTSMGLWAIAATFGAFLEPISFSAWAWPTFVTCATVASNRSLVRGEYDRTGG